MDAEYLRGIDAAVGERAPGASRVGDLVYTPADATAGQINVQQMREAFVQAQPETRAKYATAVENVSKTFDSVLKSATGWTGYVDPARYKEITELGRQAAELTDQMRKADGLPSLPQPNPSKPLIPTWGWALIVVGGVVVGGALLLPLVMPLLTARAGRTQIVLHGGRR